MEVKDWIKSHIKIDRYPVPGEFEFNKCHHDINVIVNVSDEFYLNTTGTQSSKFSYYFPMSEMNDNIGLHSMFGALHVLHTICTQQPELKVLLHCHSGVNRSPTIYAAFYYMMTGEHSTSSFKGGKEYFTNKLKINCEDGHLPKLELMELWLQKCKFAFDNQDRFIGGMLDWTLKKSGLGPKI